MYKLVFEQIKDMETVQKISDATTQAQAISTSLNFAQFLLNNLTHLAHSKTSLSTMLGSEESACDYFFATVSRILSLTVCAERLGVVI